MKQQRRSVIGPLFLITLGILFLLANFGYLPGSFWLTLIQFWPLLLILAGLEILLGRTRGGQLLVLLVGVLAIGGLVWLMLNPNSLNLGVSRVTENISETRDGVETAELNLNTGVGELHLKPLDSASPNWLAGTIVHPNSVQIERTAQSTNDVASLKLSTKGNAAFFGNNAEQWDLFLSPQVPTTLNVNTGVGDAKLDLNALHVTRLTLNTGVGGTEVVLPAHAGTVTALLHGGVGGLTILIPQGVPARIRSHAGIGGVTINPTRFPHVGEDVYESPDYAAATDRIDVNVDAGIGGITIP